MTSSCSTSGRIRVRRATRGHAHGRARGLPAAAAIDAFVAVMATCMVYVCAAADIYVYGWVWGVTDTWGSLEVTTADAASLRPGLTRCRHEPAGTLLLTLATAIFSNVNTYTCSCVCSAEGVHRDCCNWSAGSHEHEALLLCVRCL